MTYQATLAAASGLVAYYKLDEASGAAVANDSGPGNHDGVSNSVAFGTNGQYLVGASAKVATFNGASSRVVLGNVADLNFERHHPFTFTGIAKPTNSSPNQAGRYVIYSKATSTAGITILLRYDADSNLHFVVRLDAGYPGNAIRMMGAGRQDLQIGSAFNWVVAYDGSGAPAGLKVFIDGQEILLEPEMGTNASQTLAAGSMVVSSDAIIGNMAGVGFFQGDLHDLAIYREAKPASFASALVSIARPFALPFAPAPTDRLIYDGDFDSDIDDVVDLLQCLALDRAGELNLDALIVTSSLPQASGAVAAITRHYGYGHIPIGANTADPGWAPDFYGTAVVNTMGIPGKSFASDFPPAVTLYRERLAAAPDGSAVIITTGGLNSVRQLLDSAADAISQLTGPQLIAQKVKAIFIVAGFWPFGKAVSDLNSSRIDAAFILANWPAAVPLIFSGIELGRTLKTGGPLYARRVDNPARHAWVNYWGNANANNFRTGAAQPTFFAIARGSSAVRALGRGRASVNTTTGVTSWDLAQAAQNHWYLGKVPPDRVLQAEIDSYMVEPVDTVAPLLRSQSNIVIPENSTLAHALEATETFAVSILPGSPDGDDVEIFASGTARFIRWSGNGARDYEAPDDQGSNNTYNFTVRLTDAANNSSDWPHTITVADAIDSGPAYDPDALAAFARMTAPPDAARKTVINELVLNLKTGLAHGTSPWTKLEGIYALAAHDRQAARVNLKSANYPLLENGALAFIADRSFQGDGATGFLSGGFAFTSQNAACMGVVSLTDGQFAAGEIGNNTSTVATRSAIGHLAFRMNQSVTDTILNNPNGAGHYTVTRQIATVVNVYKNGAGYGVVNTVSAAPDTNAVRICGRKFSTDQFSVRELAFAYYGNAFLSVAEAADIHAAIAAYRSALGF